jgi:SAM-dependent methyltransferase
MKPINYFHTEHYHNTASAEEVLPFVIDLVSPLSIIDIGCGTGSWLKVAKKLGITDIKGIDGIHVDNKILCIEEKEFLQQNLTLPLDLGRKYDLAISLEVAEHLPQEAADNFVELLARHSDIILFSAAVPGQGGQFHLNEQWPIYWQAKFKLLGYYPYDLLRDHFWENEKVNWWYKQNMFLYAKPGIEALAGYNSANKIRILIHPELLNEINFERNECVEKLSKPKFYPTLKLLIKSLIR